MKCSIFFLTIVCASSMIAEVTSIDCPHVTPLQISHEELREQAEDFWTCKYIAAPNFVDNILFPNEHTELSYIQYRYENENPMTAVVFASYFDPESPDSPPQFYMKYKLQMDPHKPIFEIIELFEHGIRQRSETDHTTTTDVPIDDPIDSPTLKFALVHIDDKTDASFSIYQSCDGKYGWAHIKDSTIRKLKEQRKDPLVELSDPIDAALNALNIENGFIYNTSDNDVLAIYQWLDFGN